MITTGATLDKFEVLEKVGEGGMATVFRGRHTTLGREVAIKVMHPHLASSERNRVRFEREARAIEAVVHPNILKIYDYSGRDAENAWIITEFIGGPTLRELLDDVGAMMPEPAAIVGWHLCRALEAAHVHGIVHRDLKPENVMINADGEVKLMDFGIARVLTDVQVTMTGALVGSPAYMSPEQATDGDLDARSDLFSLGTVLYRMVTGTLPFRGNNPSVVLKAIIDCTYEDPSSRVPSLDHALAAIICKCLAREKEDRFESAAKVAEALSRYLLSVGIDPKSPGPWSVGDYLKDADTYEERLAEALIAILTTRGRAEAENGDTASALHTFNRVLALDEENTEVVTIIEGMRRPLADDQKGGTSLALWLAPLVIGLIAVGLLAWNTKGFTEFGADGVVDPSLPALPTAPRLSVQRVEKPEAVPRLVETKPDERLLTADAATIGRPLVEEPTPRVAVAAIAPVAAEPDGGGEDGGSDVEGGDPPGGDAGSEPVAAVEETPCEGNNMLIIPQGMVTQQVRIDGGAAASVPVRANLSAGDHNVEYVANEFAFGQNFDVKVCGNKPPSEPNRASRYKPAMIRLKGFPAEATVLLNGETLGSVGDHPKIRLNSFRTYSLSVWLDGETLKELTVTHGLEADDLLPGRAAMLSNTP